MSYTRSVTKTIAVHYSGSVSYPASQNGGTVGYSGTAYESVTVNVHVDTHSFDASTDQCAGKVGVLTGAVVATNEAQVLSIRENSKKVGQTLINGFFKTVRSDISQQINELKNIVEATLLKLQSDAKRCNEMQRQMEVDYNRKCVQYMHIFDDLDKELHNRIVNLDAPAFNFGRDVDTVNSRLTTTDMVPVVAVSGGENMRLQTQLSVTATKQRAYDAMGKARQFLQVQKNAADAIATNTIADAPQGQIHLPVCYIEVVNEQDCLERSIECCDKIDGNARKMLSDQLHKTQFPKAKEAESNKVLMYFKEAVAQRLSGGNEHDERVCEQIMKLYNNNQ